MRYLLETLSIRVSLKVPIGACESLELTPTDISNDSPSSSGSCIEGEVLTDLIDSHNPEGSWITRKMYVEPMKSRPTSSVYTRPTEEEETSPFRLVTLMQVFSLPAIGKYHYKIRVRIDPNEDWTYVGGEDKEFKLKILAHDSNSGSWTSGPVAIEFHPNFYIGNFMAACKAPELGFASILNMAEELDVPIDEFPDPKPAYKKIGLPDGTNNVIPLESLSSAVRWLETREGTKTLVHCRAGVGRSGSIAIAYKCKKLSKLSYDEVLLLMWKLKADISPHKGLKQAVEMLRKRESGH